MQKEEENESFYHQDAHKFSHPRDKEKSRTNRHMALEEQKLLADETSMQVAKVTFTEGVKQGSHRLTQPNHSSPMDMESDRLSHNSTMLSCLSIIVNRNIDSLPQDNGEPVNT